MRSSAYPVGLISGRRRRFSVQQKINQKATGGLSKMSAVYMQNGWSPVKTNRHPEDPPQPGRETQFYQTGCLFGNWFEERRDIRCLGQRKPMPSASEHNYATTYCKAYTRRPEQVPTVLKGMTHRDTFCHPGHQPELDSNRDYLKMITEHQSKFVDHSKKLQQSK